MLTHDTITDTPAVAIRRRALATEESALRALAAGDWAVECGRPGQAVGAYRRCAKLFLRAADLRAEAAALPGGEELDRRSVRWSVQWNIDAAERANAEADRLLYGDPAVTG